MYKCKRHVIVTIENWTKMHENPKKINFIKLQLLGNVINP